jgi:hypothetical protein
MDDAYYEDLLNKTLEKFMQLVARREQIDDEIGKLEQFMNATQNLLSEEAALRFEAKWQPYVEKLTTFGASLRDSILNVLARCYPVKLTAAQVRDRLRANGFNFSGYKSDPLPSVSTTLRRLREARVIQYEEFEGVAVYQAQPPQLPKPLPAPPDHSAAFAGLTGDVTGFEPQLGYPDPLNQRGKK